MDGMHRLDLVQIGKTPEVLLLVYSDLSRREHTSEQERELCRQPSADSDRALPYHCGAWCYTYGAVCMLHPDYPRAFDRTEWYVDEYVVAGVQV